MRENQRGSSPSRLIANPTRVAPSMNVNSTVRMPTIAPTAITAPSTGSPTSANAEENALSELIRWYGIMPVSTRQASTYSTIEISSE